MENGLENLIGNYNSDLFLKTSGKVYVNRRGQNIEALIMPSNALIFIPAGYPVPNGYKLYIENIFNINDLEEDSEELKKKINIYLKM